ncbi:Transcriptional regulator, contains XRE-family HTH domain [Amycolatopsis arida]|uniref:Transcriptional regulator, contains XRE-family HTH domain n=1 Tax=Amycolatopsis arida TaxID=587909 RepID=A0A1I5XI71_9PSEU|nr:helix-turn-helix transcriptional regulator [Amycolatopsis arida]TDX97433.1 transcriptional regulator with XRE-family HTH domain [Amycolatopsis arida]SFQ31640.1 Transcriptional regulator, contains XRE-family HTH domain [Amycolatopsis arida]
MTAGNHISENLARIRKARDLSQEQLAEAASVGVDTVARIEQGIRTTCRPATLRRLASALGVTVDALFGRSPVESLDEHNVTGLREALTGGEHIPGLDDFAEPYEVITLSHLASAVRDSWHAYVDGRHAELLCGLPSFVVDARRLVHASMGDQRAAAQRMLSTVYRLGAGLTGRIGLDDLAWIAAERALEAARLTDAPEVESAISLRFLAWTLVRQQRFDAAERMATEAAERIQPAMLDRAAVRTGVFGNLLFNAATAALSAGRLGRAEDLLTEAQSAAIRVRGDSAREHAIFGPRVAAIQRVEFLARAGDPGRALHLAKSLPPPRGDVPAFWEAGHRLRLAAASLQLRQERGVLSLLAEAKHRAPDWSRTQPLGRSIMRRLVEHASRRRGAEFADLAAHYGVVPG